MAAARELLEEWIDELLVYLIEVINRALKPALPDLCASRMVSVITPVKRRLAKSSHNTTGRSIREIRLEARLVMVNWIWR
jgi:hypothetical protein